MTSPVHVHVDGGIARLTLDRPSAGNSIDVPMADAIMAAAVAVAEDTAVRLVVLTGRGRLFCAGGDIGAFAADPSRSAEVIARITTALHAGILRLARMDKPLVTLVNGPAAGAGLGLALLGDMVIAERSAHFTSAYTAIGMSPDAGTSWLLPRTIGLRRAQEMTLTNRRVNADEALEWGMISRVADCDRIEAELQEVIALLIRSPTAATGASRRLLLQAFDQPLSAHLEAEAASIAQQARSSEAQSALAAFTAVRQP